MGRILSLLRQMTVEPMLFLYMLCSFLQFSTFQALIYRKVCLETYNSSVCENLYNSTYKIEDTHVQKETSSWIKYNNIALTLPSIVTVIVILGPLGDNFGRKVTLVLPIIGAIIYTVNNLLSAINFSYPVTYLLIGNIFNGLFGGFVACMMSVYSYIGHISSEEFRTIRIAILEAMTFLAGTIGVFISGVMLDQTSFVFVFSFILGTLAVALLYVIIFVRDVKPVTSENISLQFREKMALSLKGTWLCVQKKREGRTAVYIFVMIVGIFLLMMSTSGENDVLLLFTKLPYLNWSQSMYGYYKGFENFLRGIAVLTLLPVLNNKFRIHDTTLTLLGLVSKIASLIVIGLSTHTWMLFLGAVIGVLQGFPSAGIRSLLSGMVDRSEQGKMFGLVASAESVALLLATLIFNNLYSATLHILDGLSFLFAAGLTGLTWIIVVWLHCVYEQPESYRTLEEPEQENSSEGPGEEETDATGVVTGASPEPQGI